MNVRPALATFVHEGVNALHAGDLHAWGLGRSFALAPKGAATGLSVLSFIELLRVFFSSLEARRKLVSGIACARIGRSAGQQFFVLLVRRALDQANRLPGHLFRQALSCLAPICQRGIEGRGADFHSFFHGAQTARQKCGCHGVGGGRLHLSRGRAPEPQNRFHPRIMSEDMLLLGAL